MAAIIGIVIAYLLGSLSTSILITKILHKPDPRTQGSGNAGATNIWRTLGKQEAIIVLVGDILKGLLAIWIAHLIDVRGFMLGIVGLAAVIGHIFPLFFKFKGGKGVATAIGVTLGLSFISGVLMAAAWVAIAFTLRYSSLASLVAVILAPVFLLIFSHASYFIPSVIIALIIIWKHKENIDRLRSKTETKIKF